MREAIQAGIISLSESHQTYLHRKKSELEIIANETHLVAFKCLKNKGCNTKLQMLKYVQENKVSDISTEIIEEQFEERMRDIRI